MKRCLPLLILLCFTSVLFGQPINDDCSSATVIGSSNLDDGTMSGNCVPLTGQNYVDATPWEVAPNLYFTGNCWGGAIDSVVFYQFTAQGPSGSVEVSNGPAAPHIAVLDFNTTCDITGAIEVGCANGGTIEWDNALTIGNTYYIVVGFEGSPDGTFDICVFNPPPAPNDLCVNAITLNNLDGSPCNGSLNNYYPSSENIIPSCFPAGETQSVWYSFVAQGVSIASLYVSAASNAHLAVWDFSGTTNCDLSGGVLLACQADATMTNPIVIDNLLEIGNTYYVEVVFDNNATGDFSLCLDNPEPAFNDDCMNALPYPPNLLNDSTMCHTMISGNTLNNDWPSSDIGVTYGCWNQNSSYNVWFSFVAQGPDLDVTVDALSFTNVEQIAVVEFTGSACDPNNWVIWQCANGQEIDINNALEIGHTYYVAVGFQNNGVGDYCINIFNPQPPANDTMCAAIPIPLNGTSTVCATPQPTSTYANPEFNPNSFPNGCQIAVQNTVWYTLQMSDPNNVGFSIDVNSLGLSGDISVVLFEEPDCDVPGTFSISFFYCGSIPADPLEWGPINDNATYYLMIGSSEQGQGDFQVCVSEIPPCFNNNFCDDPNGMSSAVDLGTPETQSLGDCTGGGGPAFICYMGCNEFADPEPGLTGCLGQTDPVVWFTFTTDQTANILNMQITSTDMAAPSVQLFLASPDCSGLIQQGLTPSNFGCMVGSNGQLVANSTSVGASTVYYIAVGGVNTLGGEFEICISTLEATAPCVTDAEVVVESRSFGGSLEGPFFPGEVLEICMNVDNFQVSTGIQNCQWFQGLVPVFGNGWDPGSFDGQGQPLNATLNGNTFPAPNVENAGTWNWWPQVMYHHPHCFYNVGDFDGNGTLDMCNALYDPDCTGPGLPGGGGGCVGPCWNSTGPNDPGCGSQLPPGWFTAGVDGTCGGLIGWPAVDWGDGNTCSGPTGPWHFCFELTVRPYPDCDQDQSTMDLTLGFVTFADGEVGSWTGGPSVCGEDEPLFATLPSCCTELEFLDDTHDPFCSGGVFAWTLDHPNSTFWQWTVEASSSVVGHMGGSGPPGTVVIDNLTNNGDVVETVIYHFLGFDGGACPSVIWDVMVDVYPPIMVEMEPFTVCSTPNNPYVIIPTVEGGDPSSYSFLWHDMSTGPSFTVSEPTPGQQYSVTVTDAVGCSGTASVTLNVYQTFPVEITPTTLGQCLSDGPIGLSAEATGGSGSFTYNWTGPTGQMMSGSDISVTDPGQWLVVAEDSEGCIGMDSVTINFWESPEVSVFPEDVAVCPDNPVGTQIQALVTGGQSPYTFFWETADGSVVTTPFIIVDLAGDYGITVTDANGCTTELQFEVFEQESPEISLEMYEPFCPNDLALGVNISAELNPDYVHYAWSNGQAGSAVDMITIYEPGYYYVTITNIYGCKGVGETLIETHPDAQYNMPDTIRFCPGNFAIVNAEDGWVNGIPFDAQYMWDGPQQSTDPEIFVFQGGLYFITVTDDNGCTAYDEVVLVEDAALLVEITGDPVICNGVPTQLSATPGYASYEWSDNLGDDPDVTVTTGGQYYYVTISDGDGCFNVDSIFVIESDPEPVINGQSVCEGQAATLDVGTWDQVLWNTGHTSSVLTTDTTGTYTVTVTDQYGCTSSASYDVTVAQNPTPSIQGALNICDGTTTTLTVSGGVFSSYLWSTGADTSEITVGTSGQITLIVTSAEGCKGYDTVNVIVNPAPSPTITGDNSICNNVPVTLDAGPGYTQYAWSNSGSAQTIDVNMPGTYSVTVTDAQGCTGVAQLDVVATAPAPAISGGMEVCEGGSETLTATGGFDSYLWTGNVSGPTITVNTTGTYVVTVTDQYGCTGTAAHMFVVHPNPVPIINGSSTFCAGSDTDLDAGPGYVSYLWTGNFTGQVLNVSSSGTYSVTVTDQYGCVGSASITVTEATELTLNPPDQTICEGDVATLSVGNFETYQWSANANNATTPTVDVTQPGLYSVTVTDGGCMGTADILVTVNQTPFAEVTPVADACNDSANGSVIDFNTLITAGDANGVWTDLDNSGASGTFPVLNFDGVQPGVYTFQYTTNSALDPCEDVSYLVEVSIGISPELGVPNALCDKSGTLNLASLYLPGTPTNGTWQIISTPAGSNPATINGTNFVTNNSDAGVYQVEYTISGFPGNCPDSDVVSVTVNAAPDAGVALQPEQVCVGDNVSVSLGQLLSNANPGGIWVETSVVPSTGGAFNAGSGTFNTSGQAAGTYTFEYVVSGTAPCPDASATVEVVIERLPVADAGQDGSLTCEQTSVVLGGPGTSMGPEFVYTWTTMGGAIVNPDVLNAVATKAGTYTLTVLNTLTGCESMDDMVVSQEGDIPTDANLIAISPDCVGDPPGSAQILSVTGGTPPYSYSLNGGAPTSTANWTNLAPGDYMVLITDDLGCKYETNFTIDEASDIQGELIVDANVVLLGENVNLSYIVTTGIADSVVWIVNGVATCINCETLTFAPAGLTQVELIIYDPNKCEIRFSTNIQVRVNRNVYIPNVFSPNGDGTNDFFTVYASNEVVEYIEYLQVFSRWGEKVFESASNFPPAVPEYGWNGTMGGEQLMPGVFVYVAKVKYVDGFEETFKGDITLIR